MPARTARIGGAETLIQTTKLIVADWSPLPEDMPGPMPPAPGVTTAHPASASISLKKISKWDGNQDIGQVLTTAFGADDYLGCIKNLRTHNIDPPSYINNLEKVGPYSIPNHQALIHNDLVTDNRQPSIRFGTAKTMHTSVKEDVWLVRDPSGLLRNCPCPHQARKISIRAWWTR